MTYFNKQETSKASLRVPYVVGQVPTHPALVSRNDDAYKDTLGSDLAMNTASFHLQEKAAVC